ncbi:hypothetical protein ACA910_003868 [Epithemia clementina (nom. ined.)]
MKEYFANDKHLVLVEEKIIEESESEVASAEAYLQQFDKRKVELAISHKVCKILLNNLVRYFKSLVEDGLLKEQEAVEFYEGIEKSLFHVDSCSMKLHPGEQKRHDDCPCNKDNIEINDALEVTRTISAGVETEANEDDIEMPRNTKELKHDLMEAFGRVPEELKTGE